MSDPTPAEMMCEVWHGHVMGDDGVCVNCGKKAPPPREEPAGERGRDA